MKQAPAWVNPALYPFTSRWIEIDDYELHYIDEGEGDVILIVHGTPEWSFGYRDVIRRLRQHYRCVAIDMLGFGLSEKAPGEVYSCADHAQRLSLFAKALNLTNVSLLANDFGGSIAMSYAIADPQNIRSIMLFNTWMWSLKEDKHYATPARLMSGWLGRLMYLHFNFPVNVVMPSAFGDKRKLTKEIHRHYRKALPDAYSRKGAHTFAKELIRASPWWQSLWQQADRVRDKPMLFFWGMKDKFIPPYELDKWRARFPQAEVIIFDDAGHFVQEEKADEMAYAIEKFLPR